MYNFYFLLLLVNKKYIIIIKKKNDLNLVYLKLKYYISTNIFILCMVINSSNHINTTFNFLQFKHI